MKNVFFELKCGVSGFLDDGRYFYVMSIPSITMNSDGTMKYGEIELGINNVNHKMMISDFMPHIKTIGSLDLTNK